MTIATQADVEALLLRELTTAEEAFIGDLLTFADGLIAAELPYHKWDGETVQTKTVPGSGTFEIWLPGRPVIAINLLELDGRPLVDRDDYHWSEFGDVARIGDNWDLKSSIEVTWRYGLAAPPSDLVTMAADMVARSISNPGALKSGSESVGQYSTSYTYAVAVLSGLDLSPYRNTLGHYRYPVPI